MSSQQDPAPAGDSAAAAGPASSAAQATGQARPAATGQARPGAAGQATAGKVLPDGRTLFRTSGPLMLFWSWAVIAVFALGDLLVQGHNRGVVPPALVVAVITGIVYACAWRPRVEADSDGITVQNPFRDYRVPWGAIKGIFLGDSVEVQCSRPPPKGEKTIYCWALYSSRRSRAKTSFRADAGRRGRRSQPQGYSRLPADAQNALSKIPAELIAAEIGRMSSQAQARGQAEGIATGSWPWQPLAAIGIPAVALALVILL